VVAPHILHPTDTIVLPMIQRGPAASVLSLCCRYYACESLYNIAKVARQAILPHFNPIFEGLCKLFADGACMCVQPCPCG
jgi:hypothetical protein